MKLKKGECSWHGPQDGLPKEGDTTYPRFVGKKGHSRLIYVSCMFCKKLRWVSYWTNEKWCNDCRKKGLSGPASSHWNGGKFVNSHGYVMVYVGRERKKYIPEHVLIAEREFGGPLPPGTDVHHINGIKDDNRPENLEIWLSKSHPSGQRVEDQLKRARRLIATYGHLFPEQKETNELHQPLLRSK